MDEQTQCGKDRLDPPADYSHFTANEVQEEVTDIPARCRVKDRHQPRHSGLQLTADWVGWCDSTRVQQSFTRNDHHESGYLPATFHIDREVCRQRIVRGELDVTG